MTRPPIVFGLVATLYFTSVVGGAGILDKFRGEYPSASQVLEQAYSRSRALGTLRRTDADGALMWRISSEFSRRDDAVCEMRTYVESKSMNAPAGTIYACAGTKDKFFEIYRLDGEQQYTVKWFGPRHDFEQFARFNLMPLFSPYCLEDILISDHISDPRWSFTNGEMDKLDGADVARIDFTSNAGPYNKGVMQASIYFYLPSWAIAGWHTSAGAANLPPTLKLEGRVVYSEMVPIPKVSKVHFWRVQPTKRTDEQVYELTKLEFINVPTEDFKMARFGVDEPLAPITPGQ